MASYNNWMPLEIQKAGDFFSLATAFQNFLRGFLSVNDSSLLQLFIRQPIVER